MSLALPFLAFGLVALPPADLPQPRELLDGLAQRQQRFEEVLNDYTYDLEVVDEKLDKRGAVTSLKRQQYEIFFVRRKEVRRLVAEDGVPLSAERQAKVDADVQRRVDEVLKGKAPPPKGDDVELADIIDRYQFRSVAREDVGGRPAIVLDFEAQPGKRDLKGDGILRRLAGRVWVDEAERVVARAEIHATGNIKVAWGLAASIGQAEVVTEFIKVEDGVWLPQKVQTRVQGRLLLLKGIHQRTTGSFTRYRRFGADSSEVVAPPKP
jgi:hypothetical protein